MEAVASARREAAARAPPPSGTVPEFGVGMASQGASRRSTASPEFPATNISTDQQAYAGSGVLEVHVQCADGLRAADSNGKSDPYAKVSVGKKDVHKRQTKVVPKSLDPRWDERLLFPGTLAELQATTLVIKVRDKDRVGFDDHLGEVHVPLEPLGRSSRLEFAKQLLQPEPEADGDGATDRARGAVSRRRLSMSSAVPPPKGFISF